MTNFTPQEIEEILQQFFDVVGKRQYIGARYVPIFGRKGESSIEWDNSKPYEPLTIVTYQGNSYTSRTYVPVGVGIDDTDFWALTGAYSAQVEAYRREVLTLQGEVIDLQDDVIDLQDDYRQYKDTMNGEWSAYKTGLNGEWSTYKTGLNGEWSAYKTGLNGEWNTYKNTTDQSIQQWETNTRSDLESVIATGLTSINQLIPAASFSSVNTVKDYIDRSLSLRRGVMVVLGDSWSDEQNDPSTPWTSQVAASLGMIDHVTAAVAGVGYAVGSSSSIPNQVATALTKVQQKGYTASDVTLVIAFGGVNDYRRGSAYSATADGIRSTYQNARQTFPNAMVRIIAGNTGRWDTMDTYDSSDPNRRSNYASFPSWLSNIKRNVNNYVGQGIVYCDYVPLWLDSYGSDADSNLWNADNLHPAQIGHNIIAHNILEVLNGTQSIPFFYDATRIATPDEHSEITTIPLDYSYSMEGYRVHIDFEIISNVAVASLPGTLRWTLPQIYSRKCGGNSSLHSHIINARNFGGADDTVKVPALGYFNSVSQVLTLYPAIFGSTINNMYGSIDFSLM